VQETLHWVLQKEMVTLHIYWSHSKQIG
jgi:hypothetical protein